MGGIVGVTDGGLGIVTLSDPERGNRLEPDSLAALLEVVERFAADPAVRAVLLRSSGSAFCHGMDLAGLAAADARSREKGVREAVARYVRLLGCIHGAPKPVVALVNGSVKAGGVGLVSACDVVVGSTFCSFELGEAFFGIIPANVLPFLLGVRIPLQKVRYLVLTARTLTGAEAAAAGLVDELYAPEALERGLLGVLKRIWRTSPAAAAEAKSFTRALMGLDLPGATEAAQAKLAELLGREEVVAGITAFVGGSVPPWFGKLRPAGPLVASGGDGGNG